MNCLVDGDPLIYKASWNRSFKEAKKKLNFYLNEIAAANFCYDFELKIAIKGDNNFRKEIYPNYKSNRSVDPEVEELLEQIRIYICKEFHAIRAHDQEADDLIAQWATQYRDNNEEYVICSIDKDLKMIPGLHFNFNHEVFKFINEDEADYNLWFQLLVGDPTDRIPGIPGVGPIKARKLLHNTRKELRRGIVINAYKNFYKTKWEDLINLYGNLVYIRSIKNEKFNIHYTEVLHENTILNKLLKN